MKEVVPIHRAALENLGRRKLVRSKKRFLTRCLRVPGFYPGSSPCLGQKPSPASTPGPPIAQKQRPQPRRSPLPAAKAAVGAATPPDPLPGGVPAPPVPSPVHLLRYRQRQVEGGSGCRTDALGEHLRQPPQPLRQRLVQLREAHTASGPPRPCEPAGVTPPVPASPTTVLLPPRRRLPPPVRPPAPRPCPSRPWAAAPPERGTQRPPSPPARDGGGGEPAEAERRPERRRKRGGHPRTLRGRQRPLADWRSACAGTAPPRPPSARSAPLAIANTHRIWFEM